MADETPDALYFAFQSALAGRYSIDRELGRGGMGVVYLAREVHLDRMVAIKLLPPERSVDAAIRHRFLGEARLAAKLSHPNIIPIHSVEERDEFVFYVMSFIDGETLTERVRDRGPLTGAEGARILREVAWALAYAHEQGFVHRDVKPDNILLERSTGRVLVADFGIAAALGKVSADGVSGTPEFMSPEQVLGGQIDARSDIYGLGATAYFTFSGRLPFEGKTATEILAKQVTSEAPPLGSLGLTVPRKLAMLVDRCLAKSPEQRPASAQHLAEQLGVSLEQRRDVPVALRAFVRRNGRIDGGGTLLTSLALLFLSSVVASEYGAMRGFAAILASATLIPASYLIRAARALLLQGYTHRDLAPAFQAEADLAREELAVHRQLKGNDFARHLPNVARLSALGFIVSLAALFLDRLGDFTQLEAVTLVASASVGLISVLSYLAIQQRSRDIDTEFWAGVWRGRIGKLLFAIAGKLLGKRRRQTAMTHRATELSLGMAAEQLYESLPKDTRRELGDLPAVLQRLQNDAQKLREHYNELQEALAGIDEVTILSHHSDLAQTRDAVHAKLGEAVGALETIRLNLLRLHAGSASITSMTTQLDLASQVSKEVERLVEAHAEVRAVLQFPRLASNSG